LPLDGSGRRGPGCHDDVRFQADQLLRGRSYPIDVSDVPPKVHPHVAALDPTQARKRLRERRERRGDSPPHGIGFLAPYEQADAPHAVALLRARRKRPSRRAAEESDERAALHSITSSAMASSL